MGGFMATQDDVDALHRAADIPSNDTTYPDVLLSAIIDAEGSVDLAAARIWREKAATLAGLVDTTESGSSRKLSDLHKNALAMADHWGGTSGGGSVVTGQSATVPITRV